MSPVYSPLVAEHFATPRNVGQLPRAPGVLVASAGSISQGVLFTLSAIIAGLQIEMLRHQVYGCPHSVAAVSWLSERLVGATRTQLQSWSWREAAEALQVPAEKHGRLLVLEDAVRALAAAWDASL